MKGCGALKFLSLWALWALSASRIAGADAAPVLKLAEPLVCLGPTVDVSADFFRFYLAKSRDLEAIQTLRTLLAKEFSGKSPRAKEFQARIEPLLVKLKPTRKKKKSTKVESEPETPETTAEIKTLLEQAVSEFQTAFQADIAQVLRVKSHTNQAPIDPSPDSTISYGGQVSGGLPQLTVSLTSKKYHSVTQLLFEPSRRSFRILDLHDQDGIDDKDPHFSISSLEGKPTAKERCENIARRLKSQIAIGKLDPKCANPALINKYATCHLPVPTGGFIPLPPIVESETVNKVLPPAPAPAAEATPQPPAGPGL
jgi:hypothetical protein